MGMEGRGTEEHFGCCLRVVGELELKVWDGELVRKDSALSFLSDLLIESRCLLFFPPSKQVGYIVNQTVSTFAIN